MTRRCLSCSKPQARDLLCNVCCERVLAGLKAMHAWRKQAAIRCPKPLKRLFCSDSERIFTNKYLNGAKFIRYFALFSVPIYFWWPAKLIASWSSAYSMDFLSLVLLSIMAATGIFLGLVIGLRIHRAMIGWIISVPDRFKLSYWMRVAKSILWGLRQPDYWFLIFGPLIFASLSLACAYAPKDILSTRVVLLMIALLLALPGFAYFGVSISLFLYGGWIGCCAKRLAGKAA